MTSNGFGVFLTHLPKYPNPNHALLHKPICIVKSDSTWPTYLPENLTSYVNAPQVKWYKGNHEFYRYSPGELENKKLFLVKNLNIDVWFFFYFFLFTSFLVYIPFLFILCTYLLFLWYIKPKYFALAKLWNNIRFLYKLIFHAKNFYYIFSKKFWCSPIFFSYPK